MTINGFRDIKWYDALPPDLAKSRNRKIGCYNDRISLKTRSDRIALKTRSLKCQSDWKCLNPNLAVSRLHKFLQ